MRMFHITNYKLYDKRVNSDFRIGIVSDLHFSYRVSNKTLDGILRNLKYMAVDYIFIPGDLIDSVNTIENISERKRLFDWIWKLGQIGIVLLSLGNHDRYKKKENISKGDSMWGYDDSDKFFKEIKSIKNVYVLDNDYYEDERIYVVGITQSNSYYHTKRKATILRPALENKAVFLKEIRSIDFIHNLPKNKIKMILIHSPVYLNDKEISLELNEFDYFISGHMHNGCVPPILNEIWNSTRGFIAPDRRLFPDNERNTLKNKNDKIIVNGPITTFQDCAGKLHVFNWFYPKYISIINFTSDKTYDRQKIFVRRNYIR